MRRDAKLGGYNNPAKCIVNAHCRKMMPGRNHVKYFLAAFAVVLFAIPVAASADESWDVAHCKAAYETGDWASATVYCTSAAEDYSVAASAAKGNKRGIDLSLEGTYLMHVGSSYYEMGKADNDLDDYTNAGHAYGSARRILREAQSEVTDPQLLRLIQTALDAINQQWPEH